MPSEDSRYKDAYGEFVQHLINNDDYSYDYLFKERLNLLDDDTKFVTFIETTLSPEFRNTKEEIEGYIFLINPYLEKENLTLAIDSYNDKKLPIYTIINGSSEDNVLDIISNEIPFYVEKKNYW